MNKIFSKLSRSARRRWKVGVFLSVTLLVAVLLAKPAYRVFRDWRVEMNATQAREAFAAGNYSEARRLAMSVLRLKKDRHDMLVVLQRSMDELNDPGAVNISRILMDHPNATEEDRVRGFQNSCEELPFATAAGVWMAMGKEKANSPSYLALFTKRLIDQDLAAEAAELLLNRKDLGEEPELRLQVVRALLKLGTRELVMRAQFEISELMQDEGEFALPAYRLLAAVPPEAFRSGYFPELEEWVKRQEGATVDDQLLALIQHLQRLPGQREAIAQKAIDAYAGTDPAAVANWLIQVGMAEKGLDLLQPEESLVDEKRFRARARGLLDLERWKEARDWLAVPPEGFPRVELHAMRVICDDTAGDPTRHGNAWELAMEAAGLKENPNDYLELHDRMREAGLDELAREAMVEALRMGRGRLPYWAQVRDLLPWLRARQDGRAMLDICSTMARLEPTNIEIAIESQDLACIFGDIQPSELVEKLRDFQIQTPGISNIPRFKELMATALIATGQPEEALTVLGMTANDLESASPRVIIVTAIAQHMMGEKEKSSELIKRIEWDKVLREEKAFFTKMSPWLSVGKPTELKVDSTGTNFLPFENYQMGAVGDSETRDATTEEAATGVPQEILPPSGGSIEGILKQDPLPADEVED